MWNNTHRAVRCVGFTLIELLVVIAIVAAIAALLFPVFASVRERGRRTVCQSNLKQIALAMQQYVQENDGQYSSDPSSAKWAAVVLPYLKTTQVFYCPDSTVDHPAFQAANIGADPEAVDYTYDDAWLNTFLPPYPTKNIQGARESMLATPSSIRLNEDAVWITPDGVWHDGRDGPKSSCGHSVGGSNIHSGAGNYSYVDGHVKWLTPEEAGEVECLNGPLPAPGKD